MYISPDLLNYPKVSITVDKAFSDEYVKSVEKRDCKGQITFSSRWFAPSSRYEHMHRFSSDGLLDYNITSGETIYHQGFNSAFHFPRTKDRRLIKSYRKKEYVSNDFDYCRVKGIRYTIECMKTFVSRETKLIRSSMLVYPVDDNGEQLIEHTLYAIPRLQNPELFKRGERKAMRKLKQNLTRARKKCRNYVLTNFNRDAEMWTLTYAENMLDLSKAKRDLNLFFKRVNYRRKKKGLESLKYVWVAERQKRGAIHFHIMVFNPELEDTSHLTKSEDERRGSEMLSRLWSYGFCFQTKHIKNKLYITKYINKSEDFLDNVNERIFSVSLCLPKTLPKRYSGIHIPYKLEVLVTKCSKWGVYTMFLNRNETQRRC